ncbi:microsomal triacylglycerol transfer protein isoform X2 [Macrosteles quadrilineatus]|uniref:microsomal triacylglycerol transfer protein isoform X2 n=1 Tax=Macrosteles quadrilineatus TaxID=74068 RepID=UPI0023E2CD17|nr:microsomal triacylglycerol transfer protein isoform X2 [Macrosteles quadrilineatus]
MAAYSLLVLFIFIGLGSHCLMAPAAAGGSQLFEPTTVLNYDYESTLLLNEPQPRTGKDVGYQVSGKLKVECVWQLGSSSNKLLKVTLEKPKLSIKSRKAPSPEGFVFHSSKLEELKNSPFLVHWNNGHVKAVYVNQNEPVSMVNLKKGIASFFQFQLVDQEVRETDASGLCTVQYTSLDRNMIEKDKTNCEMEPPLPFIRHPEEMWSAAVSSKRRSVIFLTEDLDAIKSIESEEKLELHIPLRGEAGGSLSSHQQLKLTDRSTGATLIQESSLEGAVKQVEKTSGQSFAKHQLTLTKEDTSCSDGTCPSFHSLVKENRDPLKTENLGTIRSASAFIKLLNIARDSKKEDLVKALKNSKNKSILLQLLDILGAAQTAEAHEAARKILDFRSQDSLDLNERYLWSLSFGSHPVSSVIKDLLLLMESGPYNEKLDETLVLSVAAMTNKIRKHNASASYKVSKEVLQVIVQKLKKCSPTDDGCCLKYVRALKNLADQESVPTLLTYTSIGSKKVSVAAINAIHSFQKDSWTPEVLMRAKTMFFQLDKRYDSSARTLALDILLENGPDEALLTDLLIYLRSPDPAYEVKTYLLQRLHQIGESDRNLIVMVKGLLKSLNLTNYHILGQKGLSTAFTRSFMKHASANGSLSTVQEMYGGIVKRGTVDVIIDRDGSSQTIFSLGLFAGGLSSFLTSDDAPAEETEGEEETAVAGMDLTVLGVQVRPFVFFNGQGELMGHVWSGTASEKTAAFQALALLQDHLQYVPLQAGFIAELSLQGGISFDLSGQVSLSIWNRNAESLVEKSAGVSMTGAVRVNSLFVHSQVQFTLATEVRLRLASNIDFYSTIALCLQLQQPDSIIKHNVHKTERIPGSKHRLRKSKYKVIPVSGRTYALNQKNNELCNVIFSEH